MTNNLAQQTSWGDEKPIAETQPAQPLTMSLAALDGKGVRVELKNDDGAGYVGTIFVGTPPRPSKVIFDTGSDYLALTSDLCNDPKLG